MQPTLVDPGASRAETPSDLGAGERDRTADLPFTRSPALCTDRASCTDDTDHRTDSTHHAGIIRSAGPRTGPRLTTTIARCQLLSVTLLRARSRLIETSGRRCEPGRDGSEPGRSVESRLIRGMVAGREMPPVVRVVGGLGGCRVVGCCLPAGAGVPVGGWAAGSPARRRRGTLGCEPWKAPPFPDCGNCVF
jgi:hypothetical protein